MAGIEGGDRLAAIAFRLAVHGLHDTALRASAKPPRCAHDVTRAPVERTTLAARLSARPDLNDSGGRTTLVPVSARSRGVRSLGCRDSALAAEQGVNRDAEIAFLPLALIPLDDLHDRLGVASSE